MQCCMALHFQWTLDLLFADIIFTNTFEVVLLVKYHSLHRRILIDTFLIREINNHENSILKL